MKNHRFTKENNGFSRFGRFQEQQHFGKKAYEKAFKTCSKKTILGTVMDLKTTPELTRELSKNESWASMGLPWGSPGYPLSALGRSWGTLVRVLGRPGILLDHSGVSRESPKGFPGPILERSMDNFGAIFREFRVECGSHLGTLSPPCD